MPDLRWLVGVFLVGCTASPPDTDLLDEGAADGYDTSAAVKREDAVAKKFDAAKYNPAALATLVQALPKGADLHMHLSGAATTESLMQIGEDDNDCLSATYTAQACSLGGTPIGSAPTKAVLDAWSMQDNTTASVSARHDHFFSTFGKVGFITRVHTADMLADVRRTAAEEHVSYVEVMVGLGQGTGGKLASMLMPPGGPWTSSAFRSASGKILADPS